MDSAKEENVLRQPGRLMEVLLVGSLNYSPHFLSMPPCACNHVPAREQQKPRYIPYCLQEKLILTPLQPPLVSSKQAIVRFRSGQSSIGEEELSCAGLTETETNGIIHDRQVDSKEKLCLLNNFSQLTHLADSISPVDLVALLKACTEKKDVDRGIKIHSAVVRRGLLQQNVFLGCTLLNMYAKWGALAKAQLVFDEIRVHNVVLWNSLITGYAQEGKDEQALGCVEQMQGEGLFPDVLTFTCVLKACGSIRALTKGQGLHDEAVKYGQLEECSIAGTALLDMYARCGLLEEARKVFEELPTKDVISWNTLTAGYAQHGHGEEALSCLELMRHGGLSPSAVTYVSLLTACGSIGASEEGQDMHAETVRLGFLQTQEVGVAVLAMYLKCAMLEEAEQEFNALPVRNDISWSAFIAGCTQQGYDEKAICYYTRMCCEGLCSSVGALTCVLKSCGNVGALKRGQGIHAQIVRDLSLDRELGVCTALIDMYGMGGMIGKAQEVFNKLEYPDAVAWTSLIGAHAQHGNCEEALSCFENMQQQGGGSPVTATFLGVIKPCTTLGALALVYGKKIHAQIVRNGLLLGKTARANTYTKEIPATKPAGKKSNQTFSQIRNHKVLERELFVGTALVDMYVNRGMLIEGQAVFDELPIRDVCLWNALLSGYIRHTYVDEALNCFERMQCGGISPDLFTFSRILKGCGDIGAVQKGQELHAAALKRGLPVHDADVILGNELVGMYASCGMIVEACCMLDKMATRNIMSWNALLAGYTQLGTSDVLILFDNMIDAGQSPDIITFSHVLNACSHLGFLEKGHLIIETMLESYSVHPTIEHYNCMVDSFGRAGCVDKMVAVVNGMPFSGDLVVWHNVLAACRKSLHVEPGMRAFEHVI